MSQERRHRIWELLNGRVRPDAAANGGSGVATEQRPPAAAPAAPTAPTPTAPTPTAPGGLPPTPPGSGAGSGPGAEPTGPAWPQIQAELMREVPSAPAPREHPDGVGDRIRWQLSDWRGRIAMLGHLSAAYHRVRRWFRGRVGRPLRRRTLMWAGSEEKLRPHVWAALVLTGLLLAGFVLAVLDLLNVTGLGIHADSSCNRHEFACGIVGGTLVTVLAAAAAFTWVILVRVFLVVNRGYARQACQEPFRLVPAAEDIKRVVGREALCEVIERSLHERGVRRPQIVVGSVGAGKTAVLVRLTQWLGERGAVPVPVRLRDMREDEGFRELADRRFRALNEHRFKSDGEADRIWRRLCGNGVVVVLADGLEEAMSATDARETSIRQAFADADRAGLPLIVTSRPDDALVTLDAALVELGPLDEEDALRYVRESRPPGRTPIVDDRTLADLMTCARVAEMPLYLRLTGELFARDLLTREDLGRIDEDHRLALRLRLLERWTTAVIEGTAAARLGDHPAPARPGDQRVVRDRRHRAAAGHARDRVPRHQAPRQPRGEPPGGGAGRPAHRGAVRPADRLQPGRPPAHGRDAARRGPFSPQHHAGVSGVAVDPRARARRRRPRLPAGGHRLRRPRVPDGRRDGVRPGSGRGRASP